MHPFSAYIMAASVLFKLTVRGNEHSFRLLNSVAQGSHNSAAESTVTPTRPPGLHVGSLNYFIQTYDETTVKGYAPHNNLNKPIRGYL